MYFLNPSVFRDTLLCFSVGLKHSSFGIFHGCAGPGTIIPICRWELRYLNICPKSVSYSNYHLRPELKTWLTSSFTAHIFKNTLMRNSVFCVPNKVKGVMWGCHCRPTVTTELINIPVILNFREETLLFWRMRTGRLNPGFQVCKLCAFNLMMFKVNGPLSSLGTSEMPLLGSLLVGPGCALESACHGPPDGPWVTLGEAPWPTALLVWHRTLPTSCATRNYCHISQSKHTSGFPFPSGRKSDLGGTGFRTSSAGTMIYFHPGHTHCREAHFRFAMFFHIAIRKTCLS